MLTETRGRNSGQQTTESATTCTEICHNNTCSDIRITTFQLTQLLCRRLHKNDKKFHKLMHWLYSEYCFIFVAVYRAKIQVASFIHAATTASLLLATAFSVTYLPLITLTTTNIDVAADAANTWKTSCARRLPQYAPAPCKLTFDLLTLKVVFESRVTWATSVPILVFLGLSVLDLGPMYSTDRQTSDVKQTSNVTQTSVVHHHHFMPPAVGGGGIRNRNPVGKASTLLTSRSWKHQGGEKWDGCSPLWAD